MSSLPDQTVSHALLYDVIMRRLLHVYCCDVTRCTYIILHESGFFTEDQINRRYSTQTQCRLKWTFVTMEKILPRLRFEPTTFGTSEHDITSRPGMCTRCGVVSLSTYLKRCNLWTVDNFFQQSSNSRNF